MNEELASQALESVRRQFQVHIGDGPAPELVRDYVSLHGYTTSWAVVSEPTNHYVLALFGKES